MFLKEQMAVDNQEQIAYLVTLAHDEWLEQEMFNQLEYPTENFDEWLPFIGQCAIKMSVPRPRSEV